MKDANRRDRDNEEVKKIHRSSSAIVKAYSIPHM